MKTFSTIIILSLLILNLNAQDTTGYTKFYYENGVTSSEGIIKDGKPDGYWQTYNPKGKLMLVLLTECMLVQIVVLTGLR